MRRGKRSLWRISIVIASMLLLFVFLVEVPISVANASEGISALTTPGAVMVQVTPTVDATVTALNKEKLVQEVQQLKNQNEPGFFGSLQANATLLSTLLVVIGGLIGLFRWFADRQNEREKRVEERFQTTVAKLGDDKENTRIGASILLRTFLFSGYEQFYIPIFDLAVANLRLRHLDPVAVEPLTSFNQALIVVFKEAFPFARSLNEKSPDALDATSIQLDGAYLLISA